MTKAQDTQETTSCCGNYRSYHNVVRRIPRCGTVRTTLWYFPYQNEAPILVRDFLTAETFGTGHQKAPRTSSCKGLGAMK